MISTRTIQALSPASCESLFPASPPSPVSDLDYRSFMDASVPAEVDPIVTVPTLPTTPISIVSSSHATSAQDTVALATPADPLKQHTNLSSIATAGLHTSPRADSSRAGKPPSAAPHSMTAAAALLDQRKRREEVAMEEARKTSPNPARDALSSLIGVKDLSMSKSDEAPTASNTLSEPIAAVSKAIQVSDEMQVDSQQQTSPVSMSSFGTGESTTAPSAVVNTPPVASPGPMDVATPRDGQETPKRKAVADSSPEESNKAFSYPGPLLGAHSNDPRRGMSLPHSSLRQGSPRSPSTKKHKCPYCSTEFTRHHNLKSHLLTHSQEKPYVCQTCQSRFRRLHDLKRHTKLHTGERPHICPKCGRRFARGDALARHNKGQGGCAGRRSSMGSFGGDDDYPEGGGPDESMDGLMYTNEPERMEDEEDDRRRQSLPSIKKHEAPSDASASQPPGGDRGPGQGQGQGPGTYQQTRQPSTYPPIAAGRPVAGGLYPPGASHGGSSASTSPGSVGGAMSFPPGGSASSIFNPSPGGGVVGVAGSVFQPAGITESPKPLSPGSAATHQLGHDAALHRNRSPSLTQQLQQQRYGRRTPPPVSLSHPPIIPPQLPPPPGLNPPDSRYTLHSQVPAHAPSNLSGPPPHMSGGASSQSNSLSSHGQSSHGGQGSGDAGSGPNPFMLGADQLWAHIRALENKVDRLQDEVGSLRSQLAAATSQPQPR